MTNPLPDDQSQRIKELLAAALEQEDETRSRWLTEQCAGDTDLLREVEELLSAAEATRGFLEPPAFETSLSDKSGRGRLQPGDRVGPYEILEEIGSGGFSIVYGAQQEVPIRRRVAVKLIKPGMDSSQILQRFAAEREALSLMEHPNIARVLDAGQSDEGRPFVVMEWVDGLPFSEYCDTHRLGIRERIELILQSCSALEHAHQKGVVHRDIKPSNVLVENRDGKHTVKVIDFGIAKALQGRGIEDSLVTRTGMILGTPEYMSPEQAGPQSADVDTRTDVYALGVLLYETLTGVRPFSQERVQRAALDEIIRMIREVDPPRPSTRRDAVTESRQIRPEELTRALRGDLDWIVMKALEKERGNRYQNVGSLAEDLQRHLDDQPISAGPPRVSYRLAKFARRNRALVTGLGIAFLAVTGGGTAAGIGFFQARAAQEDERVARLATEGALKEAERVGSFLSDLLGSISADEMGREARVADLLDNADFTDLESPRVEARLRRVVGNAYRTLGMFDRAVPELEKAHALAVREFGADDERSLELEHDRLLIRLDLTKDKGLTEAAAALADRATDQLGPLAPLTLQIRASQASFLLAWRRIDEALALLEEIRPDFERIIGLDHGSSMSLLSNLSLAHGMKGNFAKAEEFARLHYERARTTRHADHPRAMLSRRSVAVAP